MKTENNKRPLAVDRLGMNWKPKKFRFSKFSVHYPECVQLEKKQNELNDDNN